MLNFIAINTKNSFKARKPGPSQGKHSFPQGPLTNSLWLWDQITGRWPWFPLLLGFDGGVGLRPLCGHKATTRPGNTLTNDTRLCHVLPTESEGHSWLSSGGCDGEGRIPGIPVTQVRTQAHEPGCQSWHLCLSRHVMGAVQSAPCVRECAYFLKPRPSRRRGRRPGEGGRRLLQCRGYRE